MSITPGIILKKSHYSETSVILVVYTADGLKRYMFPGGKKKSANSLQPLSLVEIKSFSRPESDFPRISATSPLYVFTDLPFNPIKSGLAFFIAEMLYNLVGSGEDDTRIYDFLKNEIQFIDWSDNLTNYPSWFLVQLTILLGINPEVSSESPRYLDLEEGLICAHPPAQHQFITGASIAHISALLQLPKAEALALEIPRAERTQLLDDILAYYAYRIEKFKPPKSLEVLQTVFG
jgi:DNA repair protein RecO (recombination protein O)